MKPTTKKQIRLSLMASRWEIKITQVLNDIIKGKQPKGKYKWVSLVDMYDWLMYCRAVRTGDYRTAYNIQRK